MLGNSADNAPSGLPCRAQVRTPRVGAGREPWLGREGSAPHLLLIYSSFIPHFCPFCQVSLALLALIFPSETGQEEKLSCLAAGEPLVLAGWGAQHLLQANQREMFQHHQLLPPSSSSSLLVDPLLRNILQLESGLPAKEFTTELQYLLQRVGCCVLPFHRRKKK